MPAFTLPKFDRHTHIAINGDVVPGPELALANSDPLLIRRGLVDGASVVHKYGRNSAVPSGTWAGLLQVSAQFPWLTAATTVRVKAGGDATDDGTISPLGVAAQQIRVQGLNIAGIEVSELITLAGAGASASTTTEFFRVYRAGVEVVGAYGAINAEDIIIEDTAGTTDLIMIAAGEGQSQFCGFTTQADKVTLLMSAMVQADSLKPADFRLMIRANADNVTAPFNSQRLKFYWDGVAGFNHHQPNSAMLVLPAFTDIWIEGRGSALTEATANMEFFVFDG